MVLGHAPDKLRAAQAHLEQSRPVNKHAATPASGVADSGDGVEAGIVGALHCHSPANQSRIAGKVAVLDLQAQGSTVQEPLRQA